MFHLLAGFCNQKVIFKFDIFNFYIFYKLNFNDVDVSQLWLVGWSLTAASAQRGYLAPL